MVRPLVDGPVERPAPPSQAGEAGRRPQSGGDPAGRHRSGRALALGQPPLALLMSAPFVHLFFVIGDVRVSLMALGDVSFAFGWLTIGAGGRLSLLLLGLAGRMVR